MNKKIQEMQFRIDQEGVLIYNRVEEMTASRAGGSIEDIDIVLAQGKEGKEIGLTDIVRLAAHQIVRSANDVQYEEQSR
jgi:hypothetical protein